MGWELSTTKGRDGAFRNLLRNVHGQVAERANEFTNGFDRSPHPRDEQCVTDQFRPVIDLLYQMVVEHAQYRRNIRLQLGDYYQAKDPGTAMMIDIREQAAEHLAAARAEARLLNQPVPQIWHELDETWMRI